MSERTILVVDDEPHIRSLVRSVLERARFHVVEAEDGRQGWAVCQERAAGIDLLLTDIVMPGLDGIGLAARVFARYPNIHVLYMSGKCEIEAVQRDIEEKGFGFIRKPFSIDALVRQVNEALLARPRRIGPGHHEPPLSSAQGHSA